MTPTIHTGRPLFGDVPLGFFGLLDRLRPGLMLDVGAAAGYYTSIMRRKSPASRVKAFEPFPANARYFRKNVGEDPLVTFIPKAVSNASGRSRFFVPQTVASGEGLWKDYTGYSSVGHLVTGQDAPSTIDVDVCRIDDVVNEPVRLMKIDVQGAEFQVLDGASHVFADHGIDVISVEFLGEFHVLGLILGRGYRVYDSVYTILTRENPDFGAWDVIREVALSTGRKAIMAWPKKIPADPGEYCRFFQQERRKTGTFFTDLVCLQEPADLEVREVLKR